jgi:hypothetical protein
MTYPGADPALEPDRAAVEARRKEREEEFSVWVASQDIPWGTVIANFRGEEVAKSTVEARGWDSLGVVVKRDSAEGRQILEELGRATAADRERWAAADKKKTPSAATPDASKTGDK